MEIDIATATMIYNAGYKAGHHDTVEGAFTDVVYSERDTYQRDTVEEILDDEGIATSDSNGQRQMQHPILWKYLLMLSLMLAAFAVQILRDPDGS